MKFSDWYESRNFDLDIARKSVQIGIFGSFQRIEHLRKCKEYLIAKGYTRTVLSFDLEREHPKLPDETGDAYNLRISEELIRTSDIHIFYFFKALDSDDVPVNESAIQEYSIVSGQSRATGALVLVEEGTTFAGLTRGLIDRNQGLVTHMDFDDPDETFGIVSHHCFARITVHKNNDLFVT